MLADNRFRTTRSALFGLVSYAPGTKMPRHGHAPVAVSIVLSGGYEEVVGSDTRWLRPADLVFHPADEEHAVAFGRVTTTILRFELTLASGKYLSELPGLKFREPCVLRGGEAGSIGARMKRAFDCPDPVSELALESQVFEILSLLGPGVRNEQPKPALARDFVDASFADSISLADVAFAVQAHPGALARSFKSEFGVTIGEYIRQKRLSHAVTLLLESDLTLDAIALDAGFADQAHLNRSFVKHYRLTPGRYRQAYRPA